MVLNQNPLYSVYFLELELLVPPPEEVPLLEKPVLPRLDKPDEPLPPELPPEEDKELLNPLLTELEDPDPLVIPDLELATLLAVSYTHLTLPTKRIV